MQKNYGSRLNDSPLSASQFHLRQQADYTSMSYPVFHPSYENVFSANSAGGINGIPWCILAEEF